MFINIILEPQQIGPTTCLEQELIKRLFNIQFHGPKVWNSLAKNIKSSDSLKGFKYNLKKELLSKY